MNPNQEEKINRWRKIVADLIVKSDDQLIKECLRLYDPAKPSSFLRTVFKKSKKDILMKTLTFLQCKVPNASKKEYLVDMIILRIKNLFPDICQICEQEYCVKLEDLPLLSCESCGQGAHESCFEKHREKMKHFPVGFHYFMWKL